MLHLKNSILVCIFVFINIILHCRSESLFPSDEECGEISITSRNRGGRPITPGKFPWLAAIGRILSSFDFICGGSVINQRYVLTAAHCFDGFIIPTHVRLGDFDLYSEFDGALHEDYFILEYTTPNYNKDTFENDLALIRTDRQIIYNNYVKPACLPFNLGQSEFTRGKLRVIGWGSRVKSSQKTSAWAYTALLPILDITRCAGNIKYRRFVVDHRNICHGSEAIHTCKGDSGSPMMALDRRISKLVVVAMPSLGNCGIGAVPSVATNVVKFLPWINETVRP